MAQNFRFSHSTEWVMDLEIMRRNGPLRWTDAQLDDLQKQLNAHGLGIVADAVGSLRFDKIELSRRRAGGERNEVNGEVN